MKESEILKNISELFLSCAKLHIENGRFSDAANKILLVVTELDDDVDVVAFLSQHMEKLSYEEANDFVRKLTKEIDWLNIDILKTQDQRDKTNRFIKEITTRLKTRFQSHKDGLKIGENVIRIILDGVADTIILEEEERIYQIPKNAHLRIEYEDEIIVNDIIGTILENHDDMVPLTELHYGQGEKAIFSKKDVEIEIIAGMYQHKLVIRYKG